VGTPAKKAKPAEEEEASHTPKRSGQERKADVSHLYLSPSYYLFVSFTIHCLSCRTCCNIPVTGRARDAVEARD
jgi:hypothetical protein